MRETSGSGGGASRPPSADEETLVLHEEEAHEEEATVEKRWEGAGAARVRREVEHERVRTDEPRQRERLAHERVPAGEDDSGKIETLPDGSISIPLFEETLVVTRQTVLRERVIVRKESVTEWQTVEAELRRERVRFESDDAPGDTVRAAGAPEDRARARGAWLPVVETKPFLPHERARARARSVARAPADRARHRVRPRRDVLGPDGCDRGRVRAQPRCREGASAEPLVGPAGGLAASPAG